MASKAFLNTIYSARNRFAEQLGKPDPDLLAPLVNPSFLGGPDWPNLRQAWRVIRSESSTFVMSDGLSDPFSDEGSENVGFGIEILVETSDPMPQELQSSWLFNLAYEVSQQCADHGGIRSLIAQHGTLSLELQVDDSIAFAETSNETVGVLLGLSSPGTPSSITISGREIYVVTAKLLWPTELDFVVSNGAKGRSELAKRFAESGQHHISSVSRHALA